MIRKAKSFFKGVLPEVYSYAHRLKYQALQELRLARRLGIRQLWDTATGNRSHWQRSLPLQTVRRVTIKMGESGRGSDLLLRSLTLLETQHGGHTIYLPPASISRSVLRELEREYPATVGIKIIKNPGSVGHVAYLGAEADSILQRHLIYSPAHLSVVANFLHAEGLGPRVWDLLELDCGDTVFTAFVVEHISGGVPTEVDCLAGVGKIRVLERRGILRIIAPEGFGFVDFECPDCGGNALVHQDTSRFQYVDFQNFVFVDYGAILEQLAKRAARDSHFGDLQLLRGGRYLYQSVPATSLRARRDTEARATALAGLMDACGVTVKDRLVLDIECNIGMMMGQYLKLGARWCHGWDLPSVTEHGERLLLGLGCTRFSITPADLKHRTEIEQDLPTALKPFVQGCAVSYLAAHQTLGWHSAVVTLPWAFVIYEGHEGETKTDLERHATELGKVRPLRIGGMTSYQDGDSARRWAAILLPNDARSDTLNRPGFSGELVT